MRIPRKLALGLLLLASTPAVGESLLLMEPEIDGDISPKGPAAWDDRLDMLETFLTEALDERGVYDVLDKRLAEDSLAKHRLRADVYNCTPCAVRSAEEAGAERVLSVWVYRMSNLILSMKAVLRDTGTGAVRYSTSHDFRGDTDEAWLHAAERLVRGMEEIPPDLR